MIKVKLFVREWQHYQILNMRLNKMEINLTDDNDTLIEAYNKIQEELKKRKILF